MNKLSFKKGYEQVQIKDLQDVRSEIMHALGITTLQAFRNRMNGEVEPKVSEVQEIERVFNKYGKKEIWDKNKKKPEK